MKKPYTITVADFKDRIWKHIKDLPDTVEITFGQGDLSFHRARLIGDHFMNIEFNEVYSTFKESADSTDSISEGE